MDDQTGVTAQRRRTPAEIEQIAAQFADSGLNRTEFCRQQRMSLGTLNRYLKRHECAAQGAGHGELVAVELAGAEGKRGRDSGCGLTLVLSRERRIEMEKGFDGPTLQRLISLLEKM
jgi:hypothetical protein